MRKFIKICLAAGAFTLLVGIVCLLGAVFMGVDLTNIKVSLGDNSWGDKLWERLEDEWEAGISHAGQLSGNLKNDWEGTDAQQSEYQNFSGIEMLKMDLKNEEVILQEYDGTDIRVEVTGENTGAVELEADGGILKIEGDSYKNGERRIIVSIPSDQVLEKAELEMDTGSVYSRNLHTRELKVDLGAGSFESSGFLKADKAELEVNAGSISADQIETEKLEAKCHTGEIYITAAGSSRDYNYRVKCDVGVVAIGEDTYEGIEKEKKIDNKASKVMEVECSVGQVEIDFMEE